MQLIEKIEISKFRSLKDVKILDLGNFSVLAGLNNSGKSNVLRALSVFFTGETEPNILLNVGTDCFRSKAHVKKEIKIRVTFRLPENFNFHKRIKSVERFLGRSFAITKAWALGDAQPRIYLNNDNSPLDTEKTNEVIKFLNLISFRYITNRVLPLEIIKGEQNAFRDVFKRRIGKLFRNENATMENIQSISSRIIEELDRQIKQSCKGIERVKLLVPQSLRDMISFLGYKFIQGGVEFEDEVQGSGLQSELMYQTLYLIDKDYYQKFGWRQAAIWVVEEPESSLHTSLEAQLALFLSNISKEPNSRLQIIATTHSDLMIQYSDTAYFLENKGNQSKVEKLTPKELLNRSAKIGISRWTHPILFYPLEPLILVEGDCDEVFITRALELLSGENYRVACLKTLTQEMSRGGVDALLRYVRDNKDVIKSRRSDAPVIVILDWDSKRKVSEFKKGFKEGDPYHVFCWPGAKSNPKLGTSFRGIERFYSDRIIEEAERRGARITVDPSGIKEVVGDDYSKVKKLCREIIRNDLQKEDLRYAENFLKKILSIFQEASR